LVATTTTARRRRRRRRLRGQQIGDAKLEAERMDFCTDVDLTQFLLFLLVLVFFFNAILAEL
jgi:hypothetical protein